MLIDLEKATADLTLNADICIVGAGAAGVALARKLMPLGHEVCLLESGGMDFEERTQDLFAGENIGMEYYDLDHARLRFFGGTTNIWGGRNIPLDRIDFQKRDWVPHSGWPITLDQLNPYYKAAHDSLELGEFEYSHKLWEKLPVDPVDFAAETLSTHFWRFDGFAERFNSRRCTDLVNSGNVKIVLHANTVGLQASVGAKGITALNARTLSGTKLLVQAKHYVLACGAIENARLLMASNDVESNGIGNSRDLVGRFFMEHPHGRIAHLETRDPAAFWAHHRKRYTAGIVPVAPAVVMTEELQKRLGVLNSAATFKLQKDPEKGASLSHRAYMNMKHKMSPTKSGRRVWQTWRGAQNTLQRHLAMPLLRIGVFINSLSIYVMARAEQAPNPASRVVLSQEKDALGQHRANLDWRMCSLDKETMLQFGNTLKSEMGRLGVGKITTCEWLEDGRPEWPNDPSVGNHPIGGYHHMGTTRMSDSPETGVVDKNCTVHGYDNLHIAGSSVFTTGGWANPTLTILALSHRLGEHLDRLMSK